MKHKTKIISCLSILTVALVGLCVAIFGFDMDLSAMLIGGGAAASLAAAAPVVGVVKEGTPTTVDLENAEILEQDIDQNITQMNPDRFPLDTMLRTLARNRSKTDSMQVKYFEKSARPLMDGFDETAAGTGLSQSSPCKKYTYVVGTHASGTKKLFVQVATPELWRVDDTFLLRDLSLPGIRGKAVLGGAGTHREDVAFHVASKSGDVLEIVPINGVKGIDANADVHVIPNFTGETKLYRMGQAKSELAMTTDPISMYPESYEQYCQNFMAQIEESTFAEMQKKKVNVSFGSFEADNIYSMRAEMEMSFLFGARNKIVNGSDVTYFTGGITRNIDNVLEWGTGGSDRTLDKETYSRWLRTLFTGNDGSKERVLLCGSGLIEAIELLRESVKNIGGNSSVEEYLGVKVTKIFSTFGTLRILHGPLLDETGWADNGVVLDLEHVYKKDFQPMKAIELDLKSSGQKNAKAKVLQEVSCMILRYPACHALIRRKA